MQIPLMKTFQSKVIKMIDYTLEDWRWEHRWGQRFALILCQIFLSGRRPDDYKAGWKYNSLGIKVAGTIKETKSGNY